MGYNAPTNTYDTLDDLRKAIGQSSSSVTVLGKENPYDSLGGTFLYASDSTFPDDDFTIIQPLNQASGRWIRVTYGDVLSGLINFNADGTDTVFTHIFDQTFLNNDYIILFQPRTLNGFGPYTYTKSTNGVTLTFQTAPATGSLVYDYIIRYTPNILDL